MIWVGLVFVFVGFIINGIAGNRHPEIYIGTISICIGSLLFAIDQHETNPSAMDVYQGKTTLEITYKDGVPVDSAVVFKNEEE